MLEARGVRKTYGGVVALAGADLTVRAGSVHALLGENGAGKSTLVKAIAGAVQPDAGALHLDGEVVKFSSTADAVRHGVAVVSQELNVFPDLDVIGNLYPMREPRRGPFVDRRGMWGGAGPRRAGGGAPPGAPRVGVGGGARHPSATSFRWPSPSSSRSPRPCCPSRGC